MSGVGTEALPWYDEQVWVYKDQQSVCSDGQQGFARTRTSVPRNYMAGENSIDLTISPGTDCNVARFLSVVKGTHRLIIST